MSETDPLAVTNAATGRNPAEAPAEPGPGAMPREIGRYRVGRLLGRGGFGRVYLATDDRLQRQVAVKVPDPELLAHVDDVESYLAEARTVAGLDHPHIVPVYDVGSAAGFPCFVVSRYLDGGDLVRAMQAGRFTPGASAELIASTADATGFRLLFAVASRRPRSLGVARINSLLEGPFGGDRSGGGVPRGPVVRPFGLGQIVSRQSRHCPAAGAAHRADLSGGDAGDDRGALAG